MGATNKQLQDKLNMANKTVAELMEQVKTLRDDYALLEEKYYTQDAQNTHIQIKLNDLIDSHNKVTAENYALKAEIERTNRHINLAENQLHKEQQPLVVNHYHNCVINKGL